MIIDISVHGLLSVGFFSLLFFFFDMARGARIGNLNILVFC